MWATAPQRDCGERPGVALRAAAVQWPAAGVKALGLGIILGIGVAAVPNLVLGAGRQQDVGLDDFWVPLDLARGVVRSVL